MENHYVVVWSIDIWAETAEEAAREALKIQKDQESTATMFFVRKGPAHGVPKGEGVFVDLGQGDASA
jgi:hypothetical protein